MQITYNEETNFWEPVEVSEAELARLRNIAVDFVVDALGAAMADQIIKNAKAYSDMQRACVPQGVIQSD